MGRSDPQSLLRHHLLRRGRREVGPDLTHESFLAALDRIETINYPGWGDAHYRSDKWDGLDTFHLQEFDTGLGENGGVRVVGDPIVVDR